MKSIATEVTERIQRVIGPIAGGAAVGLHEPVFQGNEAAYLNQCLESTLVSSIGPFVELFEKKLVEFTGAKYAIACSTGTAALHVCLLLSGVKPDDEVLVPALSFVATANAVHYCHAIPHFVDVRESTLGVDPVRLREHLSQIAEVKDGICRNRLTGRVIRALVPMHAFGHMAEIETLLDVAKAFGIAVVEDAAESLGSTVHGKHSGTFAPLAALSFNGNKIVTTGGGGAILTNDADLAKRAKHLTTTAKLPHAWKYFHDEVGFNYRLPNLNAALGCAQLEQLPKFLEKKRALASKYIEVFAGLEGGRILAEPPGTHSNYWLVSLLLDHAEAQESVLQETHRQNIRTRPAWEPLNTLPPYRESPKMDLSVTVSVQQRLISLPSSTFLG